MRKPFLMTGYAGLLVIAVSVILMFVFPSRVSRMPEGFVTPVIAFEFIRTPAEVFQMFASTDGSVQQHMVSAMNMGNYLDYLYMLLYCLFLFLFSTKCAAISSNRFFYTGSVIAVLVLIGDAMENVQLLGITAALDTGGFDPYLGRLYLFTWVKWGGIAAIFLVLFFWFIQGGLYSKIIGFTGLLCAATGLLAYLRRSFINEIFSLTVAAMFLMMIIYCFTYKSGDRQRS